MTGLRSLIVGYCLVLFLLATLSCGSSHQLQSVSITPSTADAQQFPNGQVQFTAKGTFNGSSTSVTLTIRE